MTWRQWLDVTRSLRNMAGDWSFTKLLICCFVLMHWNGHAPSVLSETLLLSAAFGKSTWESFLQRGTWDENETVITNIKAILGRRQTKPGEPGVEPAP